MERNNRKNKLSQNKRKNARVINIQINLRKRMKQNQQVQFLKDLEQLL